MNKCRKNNKSNVNINNIYFYDKERAIRFINNYLFLFLYEFFLKFLIIINLYLFLFFLAREFRY
jgi:hypothetical protein